MKQNIFLVLLTLSISQILIAQNSWKSSEYKAENYRKVLVLAKITDQLAKRQLEDGTVKLLEEKGITAIPAYSKLTDADLNEEETFMSKMDDLQVDAAIIYTVKGTETKYKNTTSAGVSVGVPVRVGIFRGSIGTHVPLAGGTKSARKVNVNASFYNRSSKDMLWSFPLSGKLKNDTSKLAGSFANNTVNAMIKDQLFIK